MKLRSDPTKLRELVHMLRRLEDVNRDEVIKQLEDAATDIECMAEDLELEREIIRGMADELVLGKHTKAAR